MPKRRIAIICSPKVFQTKFVIERKALCNVSLYHVRSGIVEEVDRIYHNTYDREKLRGMKFDDWSFFGYASDLSEEHIQVAIEIKQKCLNKQ